MLILQKENHRLLQVQLNIQVRGKRDSSTPARSFTVFFVLGYSLPLKVPKVGSFFISSPLAYRHQMQMVTKALRRHLWEGLR